VSLSGQASDNQMDHGGGEPLWTDAGAALMLAAMANCAHLQGVTDIEPRTPDGCEECLRTGSRWVHLRLCLSCGRVGCCDSSPNRHASAHFQQSQHPVIRSFQPGESWRWCFLDEILG
jgi:uncharacterized UBP type Zn finger protein